MTFKELMKQQMLEVQRKASDGTLDELLLENKSSKYNYKPKQFCESYRQKTLSFGDEHL